MERAVLSAIGQPLEIESCPDLQPGPDEVVVALSAAALNHRDVWISKGLYPGVTCPCTPGSDGAGIVAAVGDDVDAGWMGREVLINPAFDWGDDRRVQAADFSILGVPKSGTFATQVKVPASALHDCPAHLDLIESAAIPLAGLTAWRALTTRGEVQPGETVLITGIGGGVALFALQFAVALGCRVVVTSSKEDKRALALSLGATAAFDYTQAHWVKLAAAEIGSVDMVIDGAAGSGLNDSLALCRPGGRVVLYGGTAGLPEGLNIRALFWKQLDIRGTTMGNPADFKDMLDAVVGYQIRPIIDQRFPLSAINQACARMDSGEQFGKILIEL